jgi:hypothetical protein
MCVDTVHKGEHDDDDDDDNNNNNNNFNFSIHNKRLPENDVTNRNM